MCDEMNKLREMKLEDKILWILGILCLTVFCVSVFFLLDYYLESRKQEKMNEDLSKLKHGHTADSFIIVEALPMEESKDASDTDVSSQPEDNRYAVENENAQETISLSSINPDYVFWLQITTTEIDYPVVYRDNDYYLRRDFYGEKNKHGSIFLDEDCTFDGHFLLLHGHNMKDGTMFGSLRNYKQKSYAQEHNSLLISYETKDIGFRIVAAALVDLYDANRFVYEEIPVTEEEIVTYLAEMKKHALWYEDFAWESGKKIVLLSTCDYGSEEERLVVFAIEK